MIERFFPRSVRRGGRSLRLYGAATPLFALGGGSEQNMQYMIGLVVACVVAGLFLATLSWRARRARRLAGQARRNEVLESLQRATDGHTRLDMYPLQRSGNANAPMLSGYCTRCAADGLTLEFTLPDVQPDAQPAWPHEVVDVYFHESRGKELLFHAFTATIRSLRTEDCRLIVDMPLPAHLRKEQKRSLFRVTVPPVLVPALALWRMDAEQEALEVTSGRALGRPLCAYRPQKFNQLAIADVSAGGARLQLEADHFRQLGSPVNPGDCFLMLTVFGDKAGIAEPRQFWFKCLCRHTGVQPDSEDPYIGLQFRAWSVTQKLTDPIVWHDVEESGEVPPLFEWLMKYSREAQHAAKEQPEANHLSL